jgi:hypothetical protein
VRTVSCALEIILLQKSGYRPVPATWNNAISGNKEAVWIVLVNRNAHIERPDQVLLGYLNRISKSTANLIFDIVFSKAMPKFSSEGNLKSSC